jgi:hypothetical protein
VRVLGGHVEGDPANATARLVAGWLSSRCGCHVPVVASTRVPGPAGITSVSLQLDQDEEVRLLDDRKGGAVISQPYRPDSVVALPDRPMGELVGEELRRLDPDEPYSEALEAVTATSGLSDRPASRGHIWHDPMRPEDQPVEAGAETPAPTVPADSEDADEVALAGEHDLDLPDDPAERPADRAVTP